LEQRRPGRARRLVAPEPAPPELDDGVGGHHPFYARLVRWLAGETVDVLGPEPAACLGRTLLYADGPWELAAFLGAVTVTNDPEPADLRRAEVYQAVQLPEQLFESIGLAHDVRSQDTGDVCPHVLYELVALRPKDDDDLE